MVDPVARSGVNCHCCPATSGEIHRGLGMAGRREHRAVVILQPLSQFAMLLALSRVPTVSIARNHQSEPMVPANVVDCDLYSARGEQPLEERRDIRAPDFF